MSRYYGGDDYDAFDHMTNDPVDFQTYTLAAKSGNFNQVKRIVEAANEEKPP